jgi:hypothetical protein
MVHINADRDFLLPTEIATKLRVSLKSVYRAVRRGDFGVPVKVGSLTRIPTKSFTEFLQRQAEVN